MSLLLLALVFPPIQWKQLGCGHLGGPCKSESWGPGGGVEEQLLGVEVTRQHPPYPSTCASSPALTASLSAALSILGMHLFGCKFSLKTDTGDTVPDRKNFDSLLWAIVTVFQVKPGGAVPSCTW